jgi:hypothetical protein
VNIFSISALSLLSLHPNFSRYAAVNDTGAHKDSGHTHMVSSSIPSSFGAGTPHSIFPVSLNGTRVLPVLKRIDLSDSSLQASSLSDSCLKTTFTDDLFSSSIIDAPADHLSSNPEALSIPFLHISREAPEILVLLFGTNALVPGFFSMLSTQISSSCENAPA